MGAAAVMWSQSSAVMALHFGFSILAFTFTLLLVMWAGRMNKGELAAQAGSRVPRSVYQLSLFALVYSYAVIYLGAFVRHTDSAGGCIGWPLCNGKLIPAWEGAAPIVFSHRVAAALLFFLILWLFLHIGRVNGGSLLKRTATAVFVLVGAQVLSGALLTYTLTSTDWFIFTSMLHNLIVSILFGVLADLTIRSWKSAEGRGSAS
jgi:cytochrome c oxidase assembly protein subunit 15